MEAFRCQIEEQRMKSNVVSQEMSVMTGDKKTVFISCGQVTPAEKALGIEIVKLVTIHDVSQG